MPRAPHGPDYADRLSEAGFHVAVNGVSDLVSPEDTVRMGVPAVAGDIYLMYPEPRCTGLPWLREGVTQRG
jgi:hypothetical protein